MRHTDAYADQIHVGADVDFDQLWGWHGGSFPIAINQRHGDQLDGNAHIGNLRETQEICDRGHVARLTQFFCEPSPWNNTVDLRVGRIVRRRGGGHCIAFDCEFQNLAACGSLASYLGNGWHTSPIGQCGAVITVNPSPSWYIRVGARDSNTRNLESAQGLNPITPGSWKNSLVPTAWRLTSDQRVLPEWSRGVLD